MDEATIPHDTAAGDVPTLETIWCEADPTTLTCCACNQPIHPTPLLRTFSTGPSPPAASHPASRTLSALGTTISLYDRHLACASSPSVPYVSISHVWHPTISAVQNAGPGPGPGTHPLALTLPLRLAAALPPGTELWHDYLSVPQWTPALKTPILASVAQIYAGAAYTLVHLADVSPDAVRAAREGKSLAARAEGVARVCNARWFSRVWTAMEYVRSGEVRAVLSDYTFWSGDFLAELHEAWDAIVRECGDVHAAEGMVKGRGMLPWQLGPLWEMKARVGGGAEFAGAFSMLARRGCRGDEDFFWALDGVLKVEWGEGGRPGFGEYGEACLGFARGCVGRGDYTPLLMTRRAAGDNWAGIGVGYHDVRMWNLGELRSGPLFETDGLTLSVAGDLVLKAERMGTVGFVKKLPFPDLDPGPLFSRIARVVVDFTGPDVKAFATTIGTRLYGQNTDEVLERLSREDRNSLLEGALVKRYNAQAGLAPWDEKTTDWIADALGLSSTALSSCRSVSPMRFMKAQGGTLHHGPSGPLVGITCPTCHGTFIYRAAIYVTSAEARGSVAYRIPGLEYSQTLKNGIAVLVKDGRIVGRMVWATPACACHMVEQVTVQLDEFPPRKIHQHRPNSD